MDFFPMEVTSVLIPEQFLEQISFYCMTHFYILALSYP